MSGPLGVVTQDPTLVGLVAAAAVLVFLAVAYLLLVVSTGGADVVTPARDPEPKAEPVRSRRGGQPNVPDAASGAVDVAHRLRLAPTAGEAEDEAAAAAPSLRAMALVLVEAAELRDGDRILDAGNAAGLGAAAALSTERAAASAGGASGLRAIGRRGVFGAHFVKVDVVTLPFPPGWFHVVVSLHALQLADDPVAVLAEWRRVTIAGGRLSLSIPGPAAALTPTLYDPVYRQYGLESPELTPTGRKLSNWARAAGWRETKVRPDPKTVIQLAGPDALTRWIRTAARSAGGAPLSARSEVLTRNLLASVPTGPDGHLQIPFGTLYLTARNPRPVG